MGKSMQEILHESHEKSEILQKKMQEAQEAMQLYLVSQRPDTQQIESSEQIKFSDVDAVVQDAQCAYLDSQSLYNAYCEALAGFPKDDKAYDTMIKFRETNKAFLEGMKKVADVLELSLMEMKPKSSPDQSRQDSDQALEEDEKAQKKCSPGCTIL